MNIEEFKQSIRGSFLVRGETGFDEACGDLIWNGRKPSAVPDVIVRAQATDDVVAAIHYARSEGLTVTPRGGGHQWSGVARRLGMIIDLSAIKHLEVDAKARIADVGPGVTAGELAQALAAHGLAFPVGHCPTVPVSGFLLGGGIGWNFGAWGVGCFNVERVEVVTADGRRLNASAGENADLFWAARGAGAAFFGIVTAYRLRLQPLPGAITTRVWPYDLSDLEPVVRWAASIRSKVPNWVEMTLVCSASPPPLRTHAEKVVVLSATAFSDDGDEARRVLEKIGGEAPPGVLSAEGAIRTPFAALFDVINTSYPADRRYAANAVWSRSTPERFFGLLAERVRSAPSAESLVLGLVMPAPWADPHDLPDAAFSMVAPLFAGYYAIWSDAEADEANLTWLRETDRAIGADVVGRYIGEADLDRHEPTQDLFSLAAREKLEALRKTYDPGGLFGRAP